jgi:hypothetical protein
MPRQSAASFHAAPLAIRHDRARLAVPDTLPPAEAAVWHATVNGLPGEWFSPEQAPMLTQYCRLVVQADVLARLLADSDPTQDLDEWGKLVMLAGVLSSRILAAARAMRLTQQARDHPTTARNHGAGVRPERTAADDAEAVRQLVALRRSPEWGKQ